MPPSFTLRLQLIGSGCSIPVVVNSDEEKTRQVDAGVDLELECMLNFGNEKLKKITSEEEVSKQKRHQ